MYIQVYICVCVCVVHACCVYVCVCVCVCAPALYEGHDSLRECQWGGGGGGAPSQHKPVGPVSQLQVPTCNLALVGLLDKIKVQLQVMRFLCGCMFSCEH